jgi:hypothetical protein
MLGELRVVALDAGLVAAGTGDGALQLVGHKSRGDSTEVFEGPYMARKEVGRLLGLRGLGEAVARGSESGDKEFDLLNLAGLWIDDVRLLARVVDKQLLTGPVKLAHGALLLAPPPLVVPAELGVPVAVRMLPEVLDVEQLQGDADAVELSVDVREVRQRTLPRLRRAVQPRFELRVAERLDLRPAQPRLPGPVQGGGHRPDAHGQTASHLPVAPAQSPLLPENLSCLPHGQPLGRHLPSWVGRGRPVPTVQRRSALFRSPPTRQRGYHPVHDERNR